MVIEIFCCGGSLSHSHNLRDFVQVTLMQSWLTVGPLANVNNLIVFLSCSCISLLSASCFLPCNCLWLLSNWPLLSGYFFCFFNPCPFLLLLFNPTRHRRMMALLNLKPLEVSSFWGVFHCRCRFLVSPVAKFNSAVNNFHYLTAIRPLWGTSRCDLVLHILKIDWLIDW